MILNKKKNFDFIKNFIAVIKFIIYKCLFKINIK